MFEYMVFTMLSWLNVTILQSSLKTMILIWHCNHDACFYKNGDIHLKEKTHLELSFLLRVKFSLYAVWSETHYDQSRQFRTFDSVEQISSHYRRLTYKFGFSR